MVNRQDFLRLRPRLQAEAQKAIETMRSAAGEELSESRAGDAPYVRAIIADWLLRKGFTTREVGEALGKDHSTVTHYRQMVEQVRKYPASYKGVFTILTLFEQNII